MRLVRTVNAETLNLLKRWEGLVLYAYDDADGSTPKKRIMPGDTVRGVLTIGWGHTATVRPGMEITEAEAHNLFLKDLAPCERAVERAITVPLTDGQFGALVSFVFNLGTSMRPGAPLFNIAKTLNTGDYAGAIRRMQLYNKTRDRKTGRLVLSEGLVNRRQAEAGLWARGSQVAGRTQVAEAGTNLKEAATTNTGVGAAAVAASVATAAPAIAALQGLDWRVAVTLVVVAAVAYGAVLLWRTKRG